jgi:hypothetical protein
MKHDKLEPVFVEFMPESMDSGKLYVSHQYRIAIHLCACGCGIEVVTPLNSDRGWVLTEGEDGLTLSPSIGNWNLPCRSHYFVRSNQIDWC